MRKMLKALLVPAALATVAGAGIAATAKADGYTLYYDAPTTYYYYYTPPTTYYYYIERPMRCHLGVCY